MADDIFGMRRQKANVVGAPFRADTTGGFRVAPTLNPPTDSAGVHYRVKSEPTASLSGNRASTTQPPRAAKMHALGDGRPYSGTNLLLKNYDPDAATFNNMANTLTKPPSNVDPTARLARVIDNHPILASAVKDGKVTAPAVVNAAQTISEDHANYYRGLLGLDSTNPGFTPARTTMGPHIPNMYTRADGTPVSLSGNRGMSEADAYQQMIMENPDEFTPIQNQAGMLGGLQGHASSDYAKEQEAQGPDAAMNLLSGGGVTTYHGQTRNILSAFPKLAQQYGAKYAVDLISQALTTATEGQKASIDLIKATAYQKHYEALANAAESKDPVEAALARSIGTEITNATSPNSTLSESEQEEAVTGYLRTFYTAFPEYLNPEMKKKLNLGGDTKSSGNLPPLDSYMTKDDKSDDGWWAGFKKSISSIF